MATIQGNAKDNDFRDRGTNSADTISGKAGNDLLHGGGGNDNIDGGADLDVAFYDGNYQDFSVVTNNKGTTVTDQNTSDGNEGKDSLKEVELLQFNDVIVDTNNHLVGAGDGMIVVQHDEGGYQAFTDFASAIAAATDGDTLFFGSGEFDVSTSPLVTQQNLRFVGADLGDETVLRGGFEIDVGVGSLSIEQLTIDQGKLSAEYGTYVGVYLDGGTDLRLEDVSFTDSNGDAPGGFEWGGLINSDMTALIGRAGNDADFIIKDSVFDELQSAVYLNNGQSLHAFNSTFDATPIIIEGVGSTGFVGREVVIVGNEFMDTGIAFIAPVFLDELKLEDNSSNFRKGVGVVEFWGPENGYAEPIDYLETTKGGDFPEFHGHDVQVSATPGHHFEEGQNFL